MQKYFEIEWLNSPYRGITNVAVNASNEKEKHLEAAGDLPIILQLNDFLVKLMAAMLPRFNSGPISVNQ